MIDSLIVDGAVVANMTAAGNVGLIVAMLVYAVAPAWALVRLDLSAENRRALIGDFIEHFSWVVFRLFWFLALMYAVKHEITCETCAQSIKANSYALWAYDWRGLVTMVASAGVALGASIRASSLMPLSNPYLSTVSMLSLSWMAGFMHNRYDHWPALAAMLCCALLTVAKLERSR